MPTARSEEERFAAALDSRRPAAPGGGGRGSANDLARDLEIVALLRAGGAGLAPDPATRDRARGRLMAAFAQEFGTGAADGATMPLPAVPGPSAPATVALAERADGSTRLDVGARPGPRAGRHSAPEPDAPDHADADPDDDVDHGEPPGVRRLRPRYGDRGRSLHRRATLVGAAAAATLVALAAGGTFASRDALPGDSLYGVKRVAESTGYALTFGEQAKARRHLEQAQRRLDEVEGLVTRDRAASASGSASGSASAAPDPELVRSTMQEFDADTDQGARLLLAGEQPDSGQVQEVRSWATQQSGRLSRMRSDLPAPREADASLALLDQVLGRTAVLSDPACAADAACRAGTAAATGGGRVTTSTTDADATAGGEATVSTGPDQEDPDGTAGPAARDGSGGRSGGTRSTPDPDDDPGARDSGSDGGSDGSDDGSDGSGDARDPGSGGGSGSGDLPLPLPVPGSVRLPSPVPGLPGIRLGN